MRLKGIRLLNVPIVSLLGVDYSVGKECLYRAQNVIGMEMCHDHSCALYILVS